MKSTIFTRIIPCLALLTATISCEDDAPLGVAGKAVAFDLSARTIEMQVGDSQVIGVRAVDGVGDVVSEQVAASPCDPAIIQVRAGGELTTYKQALMLVATGIGNTCIVFENGDLSDTATVAVGPAAILIEGPDTVSSGNIHDYGVAGLDPDGARVEGAFDSELLSLDPTRIFVTASGGVLGGSPGAGVLQARAAGGARALKLVTVVQAQFVGSLSSTSGEAGELVGLTVQSPFMWFDSDVTIEIGGSQVFSESTDRTLLLMAVPAREVTGVFPVVISDIGPYQVSQDTTFNVLSAPFPDRYQPASNGPVTAPEVTGIISPGGNIYLAHGGFGTGSDSRGVFNGGSQIDHWFAVITGASPLSLQVRLDWLEFADVDMAVCDSSATNCSAIARSRFRPYEDLSATIPANTTMYVIVSMWSAYSNVTNMRLHVEGL